MRGLKDRRFVVASGGTGIGAATAKRLAEEGGKVIVGDVNKAGIEQVVSEITKAGGTAKAVYYDLADEPSCKALIQACVDSYGGIDGLANVGADLRPGIEGRDKPLLEMDESVWKHQFDVNTVGHTRTIRAALPHMIKQKSGSIVCVSSAAAHIGQDVSPGYATTKIGLHAVIRHVAQAWGPDNIRCNGITPGPVITEAVTHIVDTPDYQRMLQMVPLRRGGTPADVAATIALLLSDDGAWVTGQVWAVGGGWTMRE
jgi:NAD(P)-dependent dehydrogenase (short-subunit alcohol dehydrogenase family)